MEYKLLIYISIAVFGISFYLNAFIFSEDKNENIMDFLPLVGTLYILTQHLEISNINAFKILILFTILGYDIIRASKLKKISLNFELIGMVCLILYLVFMRQISNYNAIILNNLNLLLSCFYVILAILIFRNTSKKRHREMAEVNVIALIATTILAFSSSYFLMNVGIGIFIVHQLAVIALYTKEHRLSHQTYLTRLSELEVRFERTVEFEAKKRTSVMAEKIEHIREKSQKDPMTKALNRHGLTSEINDLIRDSSVKIFSIAIFDIDHFKTINDTKGHIIGDECLKFLSYTFMINNRKTDVLGRYGGDEFILIMPHINAPAAIEICERMRETVQAKSTPKFTISMGVATYPYDGKSFTTLLEVADKGLYTAKENGKNRVGYDGNVFIKNESKTKK